MNIVWFVSSLEIKDDVITSKIASVRIRCLEAIDALEHQHPDWQIFLVELKEPLEIQTDLLDQADVAIFGKVFANWESIYQHLKQRNIPIITDTCEDIFNLPHLLEPYKILLTYTNAAVVSCEPLKELFFENTQHTPFIIPDIQEGVRGEVNKPTFNDREQVKLVWFGQPINLEHLEPVFAELVELDRKISLDIVTRVDAATNNWFSNIQAAYHDQIDFQLLPWSIEQQLLSIKASDIVIIPSASRTDCRVKTANRVMTSLWAGKPVVAYPLPSYQEYSRFVVLNKSIGAGIKQLLNLEPQTTMNSILAGQEYIERRYSPDMVALQWCYLLQTLNNDFPEFVATETSEFPKPTENPSNKQTTVEQGNYIKLNLGCGDKILPGYINVDLVDERAGNKPDVICDIRQLTGFEDNYADEVMTVHVIEHFYYWEAQEVLLEWVRVLKPGGRMIVECPNLLTACEEVLQNPAQATGPGQEAQRTMWILYGDPAWKDPLMCHKWLYTPDSLTKLMVNSGLANIVQEPAQFKLREPRDMRLVGYKA